MKVLRIALAVAAVSACFSQSALAHRFWIIPSSSVLSGDKPWVTVDAAISNSLFFADHAAPSLESISVTGPDGMSVPLQNGCKGKYRTTFDLELTTPGTYKIGIVRGTVMASWDEDGETKRFRGSPEAFAQADLKDKTNLKVSRSESRVETFVTSGEPGEDALQPTGSGLELAIDKTHPNDLYAEEKASFVLLRDGKPAADVEVVLIKGDDRYRHDQGEIKLTTDQNGRFTCSFPEAGRYWLNANASGEDGQVDGVDASTRYSYTATFEVLPQ